MSSLENFIMLANGQDVFDALIHLKGYFILNFISFLYS